jgi:ribokinase
VPRADSVEPTIVVVGSTMTDMIAYAGRLPDAGETVVGDSFSLGFGGKGANQAVMCALLGAAVHFVGCLGDDVFGRMTLENLASHGIDTTRVSFTAEAATGAAPIWVDATGENRIIVVPGANNMVEIAAIDSGVRSDADIVLAQLELPEQCVAHALRTARAVGRTSILNPAPMGAVDPELLGLCTWLIPNRSELDAIAGLLKLDPDLDLAELARRCAAALDTNLVVTLGADGALLCEDAALTPVAAPSVTPVDTTGAGDAFVGAFAYAIARGATASIAAAFGCACAATSVQSHGTQTSFPRGEKLDRIKQKLNAPTNATT